MEQDAKDRSSNDFIARAITLEMKKIMESEPAIDQKNVNEVFVNLLKNVIPEKDGFVDQAPFDIALGNFIFSQLFPRLYEAKRAAIPSDEIENKDSRPKKFSAFIESMNQMLSCAQTDFKNKHMLTSAEKSASYIVNKRYLENHRQVSANDHRGAALFLMDSIHHSQNYDGSGNKHWTILETCAAGLNSMPKNALDLLKVKSEFISKSASENLLPELGKIVASFLDMRENLFPSEKPNTSLSSTACNALSRRKNVLLHKRNERY